MSLALSEGPRRAEGTKRQFVELRGLRQAQESESGGGREENEGARKRRRNLAGIWQAEPRKQGNN